MKMDKYTEEKKTWVFTFGCGQPNEGKFVRFSGTYAEAREQMFNHFGDTWVFQYSEEEWADWERRRPFYYPAETELIITEKVLQNN